MHHPQKIRPCLWFNRNAEEAVAFYTSIFKGSRIGNVSYYGPSGPLPEGTVLTIDFQLAGQDFLALNGGPEFQHTPALSLMIDCDSQREIDEMWEKMSAGGRTDVCGWLVDRFGVSWQVVPHIVGEMLADKDQRKVNKVMDAVMKMTKLDIATLKKAYEQG